MLAKTEQRGLERVQRKRYLLLISGNKFRVCWTRRHLHLKQTSQSFLNAILDLVKQRQMLIIRTHENGRSMSVINHISEEHIQLHDRKIMWSNNKKYLIIWFPEPASSEFLWQFKYVFLELTKSLAKWFSTFLLYFLEPVWLLPEKPFWCDTYAHQWVRMNEMVSVLDNLPNCHNTVIQRLFYILCIKPYQRMWW